mmetsp:Transcript_5478/g.11548  ORF Transcript_5478/g.11548 Transcript_5478/m.11548 type:complete len:201 (+) Transcript_5478:1667-2269(+)
MTPSFQPHTRASTCCSSQNTRHATSSSTASSSPSKTLKALDSNEHTTPLLTLFFLSLLLIDFSVVLVGSIMIELERLWRGDLGERALVCVGEVRAEAAVGEHELVKHARLHAAHCDRVGGRIDTQHRRRYSTRRSRRRRVFARRVEQPKHAFPRKRKRCVVLRSLLRLRERLFHSGRAFKVGVEPRHCVLHGGCARADRA